MGTLFVVGTPIGNLEDLTDRARRVLGSVEVIAAEDTRRTGRLLSSMGVRARLISLFEGNEVRRVPDIIGLLQGGSDVAVVTDAGMPGISDPGYRLVAACVEAGIEVDVVPGPSAAVAALAISGLATDRFVFEGFLPKSGQARRERLKAIVEERRTVVLFESPLRVVATLEDVLRAGASADRRAMVARELTKLHQEVIRGSVGSLLDRVRARALKGEVVLVLEGAPDARSATLPDALEMAERLVAEGARKRDAAKGAARATGVPASEVYRGLVRAQGTAGSKRAGAGRRATSSE